jgi:predicted peroxiredoxin
MAPCPWWSSEPVEGRGMGEKLIFGCSHGGEDPERATLPFVAANTAAIAGQEAVVLLTIEGVRLGTQGGTDGVAMEGFPELAPLFDEFVGNGGEVWLCGTCAKPRGITDEQLAKGAKITGAANIVEHVINGAKMLNFG